MKKILLILVVMSFIAIPAMAQDSYKALTKDNEVESKEEVIVQRTKPVNEVSTLTLDQVDEKIADIDAEIARLQAKKTIWQAVRVEVDKEAAKVSLKEAVAVPIK